MLVKLKTFLLLGIDAVTVEVDCANNECIQVERSAMTDNRQQKS